MASDIDRIVSLICETGAIETVREDEDFYEAGFSSVNALSLLLELETAFGVSIPDDKFIEARTPHALGLMIVDLQKGSQ